MILTQLVSMKTYFYCLYHTPLNMEFLSIINVALYLFMLYAFYRDLSGKPMECTLLLRENDINSADEARVGKNDGED